MQLTYAESSCAIWMLALDNYIPGQALRQHDGSTFIPK